MSKIREHIMYYLELKKKLDIAAARVVNEKRNLENTATDYGLPQKLLKQKVDILRRLNNYFEETLLYDNAIRSVMYNYKTLSEAATYYKLNPEDIKKEIAQYNILLRNNKIKGPYEYDKPLDKERIFTFKEELSLLDDLRNWKYKDQSLCTCLICAMVLLVSLAYQSAREKNKKYLPAWDMYQQADRYWLVNFEMTHSSRLSQLYQYDTVQELYETCKNKQLDETCKNKQLHKTCTNKQPSSLVLSDEKNIFKVPSSTHVITNSSSRKRKHSFPKKFSQLNLDEAITQTSQTATSTISQNNQDTLTDRDKIASGNILQKDNFDSSQAYNQNTSKLKNLNAPMEQKSEVIFEKQTASASFVNNQFQNWLPTNQFQLLDCTNKYQDTLTDRDKIASGNILQKDNFDSSQAYNQNTSELRNLNAPMEQKSEVMFEKQTASASFVNNQFQNWLPTNQFQLLDCTNKYQDTLTDRDKIASGNILQKDNFDSSQAYNQNTSELRNLNAPMEQKSEVMFEKQTASASFVNNQFQNWLPTNQFQLLDCTNKYQDTLTDRDKIASGNILQKDNFDSSQAYNQNTSELRNLNAPMEQKSKVIFEKQTASASFATNQFQNDLPSNQFQLLGCTNKYQNTLTDRDKIASGNILQKDNFDSSQAYNQNTSELRNLNAPMEQKSKVIFEKQTASASFATNQFQNDLPSNQFQLLGCTNKYQNTLTDRDKIASGNILQKDNFDSSQAYNQNTSELRNLNAPMEQKLKVIFEKQTASASFATNQFQNDLPSNQFQLLGCTNKYQNTLTDRDKIASGNILQKDNFNSSQAYNQNTSELKNLNAPMEQKSEVMFKEQTAFASFATNQFQNGLSSKQNLNYLIPINIEKSINDISKKKIQSIANLQSSKEE